MRARPSCGRRGEATSQRARTCAPRRRRTLRRRDPELWSLCLDHHPTVVEYNRTRNGAPLRFSDLVSLRAYQRLPLYQYFFRLCEVEYKLVAWPIGGSARRARRTAQSRDRSEAGTVATTDLDRATAVERRAFRLRIGSRSLPSAIAKARTSSSATAGARSKQQRPARRADRRFHGSSTLNWPSPIDRSVVADGERESE